MSVITSLLKSMYNGLIDSIRPDDICPYYIGCVGKPECNLSLGQYRKCAIYGTNEARKSSEGLHVVYHEISENSF